MANLNNTIFILGGDGYLGWSLSIALANRTDDTIVIIDNLIKRRWESEVKVRPLLKLDPPEERIETFRSLYHKNNLRYEDVELTDYESVFNLVKRYQPKIIIILIRLRLSLKLLVS